ncbi:hypothetical protein PsAD46_04510 [Pseudovibrio sp. Ad46]|uniref:hypothetical protein n=1 Tax=unclassified Pseudovibrio TaxID=2627060 RepID=UPI0007AE526C|nr:MULTISPECIES: hypothetical protein [unclassified Pseudovibrio]KZK78892.1 hypothetical protein PsAD46_04510 [Pseudovibrio sp. Ad46]KZK93632.1 hypothetical protein PsAD5_02948 [Pseudovibrio sp. Ad5]
MRRYDDGEFVAKEPIRRKLRDQYRSKFFADAGGKPLKDPFDYDPDPKAQHGIVLGLIDKAMDLQEGDKSALVAMKSDMVSSLLSVPVVGASKVARPVLDATITPAIGTSHFLNLFGGKSND